MRVLVVIDKHNWAYHRIAWSLQKEAKDMNLDILAVKRNEGKIKKMRNKYDRFFIMGWQYFDRIDFLDKKRTFVGVHSHQSWDEGKTRPERDVEPPQKLLSFLSSFRGVNIVSHRLLDLFQNAGLKNTTYTPNGVDTNLFVCKTHKPSKKFKAGFCASTKHDKSKGISKYIVPAAKKAGAIPKAAMKGASSHVDLVEMPEFYHGIDCYVCASVAEGFSLSMLEAAACGRPIVSTRVGGTHELLGDKDDKGILCDRSVKSISRAISKMREDKELFERLSRNIRKHVVDNYQWSHVAKDWFRFLQQ